MYRLLAFICNLSLAVTAGAVLAMLTSGFASKEVAHFFDENMRSIIAFSVICFFVGVATGIMAVNHTDSPSNF